MQRSQKKILSMTTNVNRYVSNQEVKPFNRINDSTTA